MAKKLVDKLLKKYSKGGTTDGPKPPIKLPGIQTMPASSTSVAPVTRNVLMDELVAAKTPEAKKIAEGKLAKKRVNKNPESWTPEDWKNYRIAEPGIQYVPIEAALLPGTPVVKGLGKVGNFVLDAANPVSGIRNLGKSKITSSVGNLGNQYRKNPLSEKELEMYKWFDEERRFNNLPQTTNKQSLEVLDNFKQRIKTPEGQRRLKELGVTEEQLLQDLKIVEDPNTYGYYRGAKNTIAMNPNHPLPKKVVRHEIEHGVQNALRQSKINKVIDGTPAEKLKALESTTTEIDDILSGLTLRREGTPNKIWNNINTNKPVDINDYKSLITNKQNATDYFLTGSEGAEKSAFLAEVQQYMMDAGTLPKKEYTEVTPEMIKNTMVDALFDEAQGGKYLRLFNIMKTDPENYELISKGLNKMLGVVPAAGIGAALNQEYMRNNPKKKLKNGGLVKYLTGGQPGSKKLVDKLLKKYPNGGKVKPVNNNSSFTVTTDDSTEIYNNAIALENYYNNLVKKGVYKKPTKDYNTKAEYYDMEEIKEKSIKTYKREWEDYKKNGIYSSGYIDYIRQNKGKSSKDYEKSILNSINDALKGGKQGKYYYKDLLPSDIDTEAPSTLYHKGLAPDGKIHYDWVNKESAETTHDYSNYPTGGSMTETFFYDKNRIKPYHLRTAKEKEVLHEKYRKENGRKIPQKKKAVPNIPAKPIETKKDSVVTKPVIKPEVKQQPVKPLPFKAKYTMPDTSATPNMQGEYPLRTFYQGTNTQREADSIEDVKGLERIKLQEYMRNNPKKKLKNGGLVKYLNGGEELQQSVDPLVAMGLNSVAPGSGTAYTATRGFSNKLKESSNPYVKATGAAYDPMPLFSEFGDGKGTIAGDLLRSSGVGAPFRFAKSLKDSKAEKRKAEEQKNFQLASDAIQQANNYGASGFAPYETSTQKSLFKLGGYYNMGGMDEDYATAEVEGNEHAVDPNGTGIQFEGPNHENGGIPVDLEPGTKVFSKRLKDINGKSFAQNADRLSKKLTKATKKLDEYPNSSAIENSIAILETQRDEVFNRQEDMKVTKQAKKIMKNGGLVRYFNGGKEPEYLNEDYLDLEDVEVPGMITPKGLTPIPLNTETPNLILPNQVPSSKAAGPKFDYLTDETPAGATPAQTAKFMAGDTPKGYKVDINSALPYAGSLANILMKNPKVPTYSNMPKTTIDRSGLNLMPSKFDINPQLEKSQADVRALEESVNRNISSGSGRFAASLAAKVANMRNRNELYGQKFNIENQYRGDKGRLLTQLNSQQAGMDMNVNQFNTGLVNQQLENEYNRKVGNLGLTRQGFVDAAGVKQNQNRDAALTEADIQKVRIIAQRYGSGVLKRMFDKMVASGQMSKEEADAYLNLAR